MASEPLSSKPELPDCMMGPSEPCAAFQRLQADNDRLRAELKAALEAEFERCAERDRLRAEVERLRAAVKRAVATWGDSMTGDGADGETMQHLRDALGPAPETTAWRECQHDLLKPDTTVIVEGPWDAHCPVCKGEWHIPHPTSENGSARTSTESE